MKIIIYNQRDDYLEYIDKFTFGDFTPRLVSSAGFLRHIISENPNEDIEGIILPTAKNNPELPQIIRIIYDHKENLYQLRNEKAGAITPPIHEDFHGIILKHFTNIFW